MKYKMIDRSNIDFSNDADVCNLGFFEKEIGLYPIRCEKFYTKGITCATFFIPNDESFKTKESIKKFLVDQNLVKIIKDEIYITEIEDINENSFISINVPLEQNDMIINECLIEFKNYE